jgi:hypothetical protein
MDTEMLPSLPSGTVGQMTSDPVAALRDQRHHDADQRWAGERRTETRVHVAEERLQQAVLRDREQDVRLFEEQHEDHRCQPGECHEFHQNRHHIAKSCRCGRSPPTDIPLVSAQYPMST